VLASAAAASGSALVPRALAARRPAPPSEVIRVAVIGVRGQGRAHVGAFKKSPDAEVVAICDADSGVIDRAMQAVPDATYHQDIRRLLDDPSIDAVSIAMPNHWHSLATIWALEAGKHVYVEKPISHNVREGRAVVAAARRHGKLVQHGTQARSHQATRDAVAWLRAGGLGRVSIARGLCYKRRESIGLVDGPQTPPATLDYDLWTGPAPMRPLMRKSVHYDWHWVFDTGNGDIGNQGIHQMDIARWGLGRDDLPRRVVGAGGRFGYVDDGETPNTQVTVYDYGDQQIIFEVRGLVTDPYREAKIGVVFHAEEGYLVSRSYAQAHAYDHDGNLVRTFEGGGNHIQNFLDAIKSGTASDLTADCLEGHRSSALCHLGNISCRLGTPRSLSAADAPFGDGSEAANESFRRARAHLADNGIDVASTAFSLGPSLEIDASAERFTGPRATEANAMLTRDYRDGFVVPSAG
jgi:predicted dehydrogenase